MQRLGMIQLDAKGGVVAVRPSHRDRPLLEAGPASRVPLVLAWFEGQEMPTSDWQVRPAGDNAAVLCPTTGQEAELLIESVPASEGTRLRAELLNRSAMPLQRLRFQIGGPLDIGPDPQLTYPANSGWYIPLASLGNDELLPLNYPVHASMQWVDLYTDAEGLYFGSQDPLPYLKLLLVGRQHGQPYLAWEFPHLQLQEGQVFRFPALHLAWHRGDWRSGADLYRAWIGPYIVRPNPPSWYGAKPAWNWVGLRGQHESQPWHHADELPTLSARTSAFGPDLIQLTAYTEHGHDTGYPDYTIGNNVGGPDVAQRAVRAIHDAGRRVSIYANGRLVDPESSVSEGARAEWGVRTGSEDQVWRETYGRVTFDVMCPSVQAWNNLLIAKLAALVKRHDFDGVYVDQVCGGPSLPCYTTNHPHGRPNEAWATYKPFIASLRLALHSIKTGLFLATEGVNDLLGQYFDSMQSHEDWDRAIQGRGRLLPELYRYTFPGHLLNVGCIRANQGYYLLLGHTLGSGFDFGIGEFDALTPEFARAARWIVGQRARNDEVLRDASLCPLTDADTAGYHANAFAKGDRLLIAGAPLSASCDHVPQAVGIAAPWPHDDSPVEIVADSPEDAVDISVERRGDRLFLVLPRDRPVTVLISARGRERLRKE
jgi:hypothetical protein